MRVVDPQEHHRPGGTRRGRSDSLGRFDGSMTESMSTPLMISLSLRSRRASIPLGRCIQGHGTGHTTLGGQ
jgi:hypothetical protein